MAECTGGVVRTVVSRAPKIARIAIESTVILHGAPEARAAIRASG